MIHSANLVPNWRTGEGYPDHGEITSRWAWEFLRRNPAYRKSWMEFTAVANEILCELDASPNGYNGSREPHGVIDAAMRNDDSRALVCDPPRMRGESEIDWLRRVHRGSWTTLGHWLGARWGLNVIVDPALDRSMLLRWIDPPTGVTTKIRGNDGDSTDRLVIEELARLLSETPVTPDTLEKSRYILSQMPEIWKQRQQDAVARTPFYNEKGKTLVEFDMRLPIDHQIKRAGRVLRNSQNQWASRGGQVWVGRRLKETPGYAAYLRVLDAIEEFGEVDNATLCEEISLHVRGECIKTSAWDVKKSRIAGINQWIDRAKEISESDYKKLVAISKSPE